MERNTLPKKNHTKAKPKTAVKAEFLCCRFLNTDKRFATNLIRRYFQRTFFHIKFRIFQHCHYDNGTAVDKSTTIAGTTAAIDAVIGWVLFRYITITK